MVIDHLGIAVADLSEGIEQWTKIFGYKQETNPVENSKQKVKVVFLTKAGSLTIKLISPTEETSAIYRFAKKGGGLHHICFKVDDLSGSLIELKSQGLRVLTEPQPGEAFCDDLIAFMSARNGLNVEIIDTDCRAELIID